MSLNPKDINELKESFDCLVQRNYEVQGDVKTAIGSEDYLKAINIIKNFIRMVDEFKIRSINMAQNYKKKADDENESLCSKVVKMAEHIKASHLEVEQNILKKYIKKDN